MTFYFTLANALLLVAILVLHKLHRDSVANALDEIRKALPQ